MSIRRFGQAIHSLPSDFMTAANADNLSLFKVLDRQYMVIWRQLTFPISKVIQKAIGAESVKAVFKVNVMA